MSRAEPIEHKTAMVLTEEEWNDVAEMVAHFRMCTDWVDNERQRADYQRKIEGGRFADSLTNHDRRRALALRIIEATR